MCSNCRGEQLRTTYHDNNSGKEWTLRYKCQVCGSGEHDSIPDDLRNAYPLGED